MLELGQVTDSFEVRVDGQQVVFNQVAATGDITPYLREGLNELSIRVASTLNNRLMSFDEKFAMRGIRQNYGLVGPVRLIHSVGARQPVAGK